VQASAAKREMPGQSVSHAKSYAADSIPETLHKPFSQCSVYGKACSTATIAVRLRLSVHLI